MSRASPLSLDAADIAHAGDLLVRLLAELEDAPGDRPVLPALDRTALSALAHEPVPATGVGIDALFADIRTRVIPNSTAIAHPRFLAYVLGGPNGIAPFAEAIAAALNQNCNFWQLSPAANAIEQRVVSFLAALFGFPATAGGLLTSGGSAATQVALTVAIQDRHPSDFRDVGLQGEGHRPLVVYTSDQAHGCVVKAAVMLGLGRRNVRLIPVDAQLRIQLPELAAAIRADRRAGLRPFCVVATAGTINTGAIDPLEPLALLCDREELWLHVDGAFGALFVLSDRLREQLMPIGRAASVALDPHKLLFAPLEAGCVIARDREALRRAFDFTASYLSADADPLLTNFMDIGPQLSRDFKAFKVWCALRGFGLQAFRDAVDRMLDLAAHLGERIAAEPDLELLAPVSLTAVCFRLKETDDDGNELLLRRLVDRGIALLGPVRLQGRLGLRACITNHRTSEEDLDATVDAILQLARALPR